MTFNEFVVKRELCVVESYVTKDKVRVLIADPSTATSVGVKRFLEVPGTCEIAIVFGDGLDIHQIISKNDHDVLLVDAVVPGTDIFGTIGTYKKCFPTRKVLVCRVPVDLPLLQELYRSGADGFISEDANAVDYRNAVRTVVGGGTFLSRNLTKIALSVERIINDPENAYGLTNREIEVLSLLADGLCNKEIANRFGLSVRTIEAHRLNIRRKTSSGTLSELVQVARSLGISHFGEAASDDIPGFVHQAAE